MSLEAKNLQCIRGDRELFTGLSFQLEANQLMMLEGQNGSGKTTLLRTLCGLYLQEQGEVLWDGVPIKKQDEAYRKQLLYLGHLNGIKADLTVLENLRINSALAGENPSTDILMEALDTIGLTPLKISPPHNYHKGKNVAWH
jgi:heme exporter protein A